MTGNLFDQRPPTPAPERARPIENAKVLRPDRTPDVARVIEHKAGLFRRIESGVVKFEFQIHELRDGRIFNVKTTGERWPAYATRELIDSSIASGLWREVPA